MGFYGHFGYPPVNPHLFNGHYPHLLNTPTTATTTATITTTTTEPEINVPQPMLVDE